MRRRRILCAEDDPALLRLYREVLTQAGFVVDTFDNGVAALEALQESSYDLIVTDHNMPRMCGLELARRARAGGFDRPVIIATTYIMPLLEEDLSAIRFAAILLKPFPMANLVAAIRRALTGAGSGIRRDDAFPAGSWLQPPEGPVPAAG